jgi:hypothetical protein
MKSKGIAVSRAKGLTSDDDDDDGDGDGDSAAVPIAQTDRRTDSEEKWASCRDGSCSFLLLKVKVHLAFLLRPSDPVPCPTSQWEGGKTK